MASRPLISPNNSPHKRARTLISSPDPSSPISKGKSKIDEATPLPDPKEIEDESGDCCGICLSERGSGGISRGYLDSCDHYFCFLCIMEWGKVESKCPLCKRRFSTIRRPPKPPVFPSERVVRIPVRDQVYHYSGNSSISPLDLYSESKCTVCHGVANESLLLLCDLCDCAAHTYCVGLGATVPEGDWFCQECTVLKDEQLKSESNSESGSGIQIIVDPVHRVSSNDEHVSVFDIVQETDGYAFQRCRSRLLNSHHSSRPSTTDININISCPTNPVNVAEHPTKLNARTLQNCRDVHGRIRIIRDNWNGFRSGMVHFSSRSDIGNISIQKPVTGTYGCQSCNNQPSTAQCSSSHTADGAATEDIEKAWKMLDKAKSVKQRLDKSNIVCGNLNQPVRINAVKMADNTTSTILRPSNHQSVSKNGSVGQQLHHHSLGNKSYKQPAAVSGERKWRGHAAKEVNLHLPKCQEGRSSNSVQNPTYPCNADVRNTEVYRKTSCERSDCVDSAATPASVMLRTDVKEVNHPSSSNDKLTQPMVKRDLKKNNVGHQKYCDAKSEIQSLVKLNLKLQTEEEKLEVNTFKEIARLATHSILAACDLEHPKPGSCSIPGFSCSHPDEVRLQKVSLMPNCCRECFFIYAKEMVNTVLLKNKTQKKN